MVDTYLLGCNACGRCCNSAPTLSLRELFRHRHRFVGALTIRRVPKRRIGERRRADDRPATRELRGFAQALERARHALAAMPAPAAGTREDAPRIDAWLDADPLAA
ncbi:hypothetical protein J2785_000419 [Burkholderia ambifaria]|nr:hypothetical protein [Burkholderia ambifaria]